MKRTAVQSARVLRLYRENRAHQRAVQLSGGGCLTVYPNGRTELSYASAPYGEHAVAAFASARQSVAFLARQGQG